MRWLLSGSTVLQAMIITALMVGSYFCDQIIITGVYTILILYSDPSISGHSQERPPSLICP